MDRNSQLIRVLNLLYDLLTSPVSITVKELSERFKVHPKTIRRDIQAIQASRFELEHRQGNDGKTYCIKQKLQ